MLGRAAVSAGREATRSIANRRQAASRGNMKTVCRACAIEGKSGAGLLLVDAKAI